MISATTFCIIELALNPSIEFLPRDWIYCCIKIMIYTLCIANEYCLKSPTIYIGQIGSANKTTSGIQYCTFRVSYILCIYTAILTFLYLQMANTNPFLAMTPGYVIISVFMIGVALLGQTCIL